MALTNIEKVRIELQDTEVGLLLLSDDEIQYFLDKNNNSVARASIDGAKSILLKLSMRSDETVDIFSIKGSKAAEQYRESLKLYLRDPFLNPVLTNVQGWVGGVSNKEMTINDETTDNNYVDPIGNRYVTITPEYF